MDDLIYALCALTSFACAWLLIRAYSNTRSRLLFWSSLCFFTLSVNNILLLLDKTIFLKSADLTTWRLTAGLVALLLLLFGLIWEES